MKCLTEFELPSPAPTPPPCPFGSLLAVAWLKTLNALINECQKERGREQRERKSEKREENWIERESNEDRLIELLFIKFLCQGVWLQKTTASTGDCSLPPAPPAPRPMHGQQVEDEIPNICWDSRLSRVSNSSAQPLPGPASWASKALGYFAFAICHITGVCLCFRRGTFVHRRRHWQPAARVALSEAAAASVCKLIESTW